MQIGSDRAIAKPIRQRKGVEELGRDQWRSRDGARLELHAMQVCGVTFRCETVHAKALFCAPNHHTDTTTKVYDKYNVGTWVTIE